MLHFLNRNTGANEPHAGACRRLIVECEQDADGQARVEIGREYVEASKQGEGRDGGDYLCCRSMRKRLVAQHYIDGWTALNGTETTGHGAAGECDELMRGRVEGTAGAGYVVDEEAGREMMTGGGAGCWGVDLSQGITHGVFAESGHVVVAKVEGGDARAGNEESAHVTAA